jgi:hypothetical protein
MIAIPERSAPSEYTAPGPKEDRIHPLNPAVTPDSRREACASLFVFA